MPIITRKRFYTVLFSILFVLVLAGGLIYWQLRDLEHLKNMIAEQLGELTQREVTIDRMEIDWSKGIGVKLHRLALRDPKDTAREFTADQASVTMALLSLIRQDVKIRKVSLEGAKLTVIRKNRNDWQLQGLGSFQTDDSGVPQTVNENWKRVRQLELINSSVEFVDEWTAEKNPIHLTAEKVNASLSKPLLRTALLFVLDGELPGPENRSAQVSINGMWRAPNESPSSHELEGNLHVYGGHLPQFSMYLNQMFALPPREKTFSAEVDFTWNPGKLIATKGRIALSETEGAPRFSEAAFPEQPESLIDFNVTSQPDTVHFKKLNYRSNAFNFQMDGAYSGFAKNNPRVSLNVSSSPFAVEGTQQLLPFKLFFTKTHQAFQKRFKRGQLEIKSLHFSGTLKQLNHLSRPENLKRLNAYLHLNEVDFGAQLPQLEAVSGALTIKPEGNTVNISHARYADFSISGLSGSVKGVMQHPVVSWTIDTEFELAELKHSLRSVMDTRSFEKQLAFFQNLQGKGQVHMHFRGPLDQPEQLEIEGTMELRNASFKQVEFAEPFKNVNGRLRFTNRPENPILQAREGPAPWEVKFEDLSGELGPHKITELAGETTLEKDSPVRRIYGKVKLGLLEAAEIASSSLLGQFESALKEVSFSGGEVLLDFRGEGSLLTLEPSGPLGLVALKNVTLRHKSGFRPLVDVSGFLYFDENKIRVETNEAWYGGSPIKIKGQYLFLDSKNPELVLRASSSEFKPEDFADIPFLQDLEYDGPAKMEFIWQSNNEYKKFENHVDLTRVAYQYGDWLTKPVGVANQIDMVGKVLSKGGLDIKEMTFDLKGNRITGHARVEQPSNPQFSAHIETREFDTQKMSPYIPPLESNLGGTMALRVDAKGDVSELERASYQGEALLRGLKFQDDRFQQPFTVEGDVHWKGKDFSFTQGWFESGKTRTRFNGHYFSGPTPKLELTLKGDGIYLNELMSPPDVASKGKPGWWRTSKLLNQGTGTVKWKLDRFKYKHWTLKEVAGDLSFKDREVNIGHMTVGRQTRDQIEAQGKISLSNPKNVGFEGLLLARNIRAEGFLGIFGPLFEDSLNGQMNWFKAKLKSRGASLEEMFRNLEGDLAFDLAKGQLQTARLRHGVNRLFEFKGEIKPEELKKPLAPYVDIFGEFIVKKGMARTENFQFEEPEQHMSMVGDFDMGRFHMDTVAGVAPLREIDRFLTKIPLFGKILTAGDEESLFKNYYKIVGPFDNPDVSPVPFTSLGKKVIGIFQGILQTPGTLLLPQPERVQE